MRQNLATLLTRDQIVAALDQIVANNINLRPSTKFDLEYNGRTFPPKEVIREAARLAGMDPDRFWLNGGPPTNDALVKLGFTVAPKAFTNQSGPRELIDALKAFMDTALRSEHRLAPIALSKKIRTWHSALLVAATIRWQIRVISFPIMTRSYCSDSLVYRIYTSRWKTLNEEHSWQTWR
jgi:hypothetical protein